MRRSTLFLTVAVLIAASCGGGDDASPATDVAVTPAPPATVPATTEPPATDPPATDPPATDPPATDPPATDPPTTEAPVDTEPAAPALEIVEPGPYRVGVRTIAVTDERRDRTLSVDVWFPIADEGTRVAYQYLLIPGVYYESPVAVVASPPDIAPDGPFPLVVYSHGSGGLRYIASYYTEMLASHGYIVAAPDHTGNTAVDRLAGSEAERAVNALNRPQDVAAVIDAMTDPENPETAGFVAALDPERIAVTGHSFGGFTAYAMVAGFDNELGSFDPDPRVDAIIPLAPAVGGDVDPLLTDERLASITTPQLVIVGTNDRTTPVDPNVTRVWELAGSVPFRRVELVDAQHQSFTDLCDYQVFLPNLADVPEVITETIDSFAAEGCSPGDMPIERAKELTNTFAVNFLDAVLKDAELYRPDAMTAPADIIFLAR